MAPRVTGVLLRHMHLRPFGLILLLIVACVGRAGAVPTHDMAGLLSPPECSALSADLGEVAATLTEADYAVSTALLSRTAPGLELGRDGTGDTVRRAGPRGTRASRSGLHAIRTDACQATRARVVVLSHLEFATDLAAARAGTLSSRSTAPPPHTAD